MITAYDVASALTPSFLDVVHRGEGRPVVGLDIADSREGTTPEPGDLVLAVGFDDVDDLLQLIDDTPGVAGVVVPHAWSTSRTLRARCQNADLALLALAEGTTWSIVVGLLRTVIDAGASGGQAAAGPDQVYGGLFAMADTVGAILDAPVTIEDATSRVVAYSSGQDDVDAARMATIFGRQVPRRVREHYRSSGVFRRMAHCDEPFHVPAHDSDGRGRYVVPVHAGGEWLGSVWAVIDTEVPPHRAHDLGAATELIALHLLRLRAHGELAHQARLDRVRSALLGTASTAPLPPDEGPWRVVVLDGPEPDLQADARRELWLAIARRAGWRQPLIADLDDRVHAIVRATGTAPGSWQWLHELVRSDGGAHATLTAVAGGPAQGLPGLAESRRQAEELDRIGAASGGHDALTVEDAWPAVTVARAVEGLAPHSPVSPLHGFVAHGHDPDGTVVATLEAVLDRWGEPGRAARQLGVHPNTVRYRLARLAKVLPLDLEDPAQRLALRLEIARVRSAAGPAPSE
ncbi:PucR family transcriptional regulator [Aeromicrobium sp. CTD01-1L150]|uniref:PucR family transcriptional regulator n=1 Tax=Aeromicrobium sp. CTD01-1L150 TaxID=3341830 RepID=UPI0035BF4C63